MYVKIWTPHGDRGSWYKASEEKVESWGNLNYVFEVDEVRSQFYNFDDLSKYYEFRKHSSIHYDKAVGQAPKDAAFHVVDLQMERDGKGFRCLVHGVATIYIMNKRGDTIDRMNVQEFRAPESA